MPDLPLDHPLTAALTLWDALAVALLLVVWIGSSWMIERGPRSADSMSAIMDRRREDWMRRMAERDQRIFDAALLQTLQNSANFFASATLLAIGGLVALLAEPERLTRIASELPITQAEDDPLVWEMKLLLLLAMAVTGFLKFAWCARLFSYCSVLMGATPLHVPEGPNDEAGRIAEQAAALNRRAGLSFNRGLRTLYFALAAMAWLIGPAACILATALVARLIYRREFLSISRDAVARA